MGPVDPEEAAPCDSATNQQLEHDPTLTTRAELGKRAATPDHALSLPPCRGYETAKIVKPRVRLSALRDTDEKVLANLDAQSAGTTRRSSASRPTQLLDLAEKA
jgi:hypothetical protein